MKYRYGVQAEILVAKYFESIGYSIIAQRFRTQYGEIDLIVKKEKSIIFVEVKARKFINVEFVQDIVTEKQINRCRDAASVFIANFSNNIMSSSEFSTDRRMPEDLGVRNQGISKDLSAQSIKQSEVEFREKSNDYSFRFDLVLVERDKVISHIKNVWS